MSFIINKGTLFLVYSFDTGTPKIKRKRVALLRNLKTSRAYKVASYEASSCQRSVGRKRLFRP